MGVFEHAKGSKVSWETARKGPVSTHYYAICTHTRIPYSKRPFSRKYLPVVADGNLCVCSMAVESDAVVLKAECPLWCMGKFLWRWAVGFFSKD